MEQVTENVVHITGVYTFISALVSAGVAFITALLTIYFTNRRALRAAHHRFTEILYEKRYAAYGALISITHGIGRVDIAEHRAIRDNLRMWEKESNGFLVMSDASYQALGELKDILKKNPRDGSAYSEEQIKNLRNARNVLRKSLRDDFRYFDLSEQSAFGMTHHLKKMFLRQF